MQIEELTDAIQTLLEDYQADLAQGVSTAGEAAAESCKKQLKQTSPRQHGDYAKSWKITRRTGRVGEPAKFIVHNEKHYQLTHLLEFGHAKRGGGRVRAYPHIASVEEAAAEQFLRDVEELIGGD